MAYLDRIFETASESVTIPNPLTFSGNVSITQTKTATSGVERSATVGQTNTGAGASAEALAVTLTTDVALGTYANAICAKIDLNDSGSVTGLAGVICAELDMPAGSIGSAGTYAVYEAEINVPTSYVGTVPMAVFSINTWGGVKTAFDDYGYLFDITGVKSGATDFFYDHTDGSFDGWLKCRINGATYYIPMMDGQAA